VAFANATADDSDVKKITHESGLRGSARTLPVRFAPNKTEACCFGYSGKFRAAPPAQGAAVSNRRYSENNRGLRPQ
jgi:hypothetical protein